jgi:hypothetical protein
MVTSEKSRKVTFGGSRNIGFGRIWGKDSSSALLFVFPLELV